MKTKATPQKQPRTAKATEAAKAKGVTFQPGKSGNPGGKPAGTRNRLQGDFLKKLADDFEENGKDAIEAMRTNDPSGYVRAIASLMPKQLEIERPLQDISDDELVSAVDYLRSFLAAQVTGSGIDQAQVGKSADIVQAVH